MKNEESKLQRECVRWFRYAYPAMRLNLFAIPNGGKRNLITASIMKAEGVLPGVADLFLAVVKRRCDVIDIGMFIEMKIGKNKQSEHQIAFQEAVETEGYRYVICRSFDEFKKEVDEYLS